jgi:hypothetical protein
VSSSTFYRLNGSSTASLSMSLSLVNGLLSVSIVATCIYKSYSIYSIIDHVRFIIILCIGDHQIALHFSERSCDVGKALKIIMDTVILSIIRYLFGTWINSCYSMKESISAHSSTWRGNKPLSLRSSGHPNPLATLLPRMFHSPCLGIAIPNFYSDNLNHRLEVCHDWTVSAVYVLSCHKFCLSNLYCIYCPMGIMG